MARYTDFQQTVWQYYEENGRHDMPWRQAMPNGSFDPYIIWISEIMLQQTQVARVIPKFQAFIQCFPTVDDLAEASLADVLQLWIGLGYNRRAKFLLAAAQTIRYEYKGNFPRTVESLSVLPGIGPNTAGAIMAYAYNQPVIFIETNIRTVFIHHFFADKTNISDQELRPLIGETLSTDNPREWYWSLMDYGSYLKTHHGNAARDSKHYTKQAPFSGSRRQVRGRVLKALARSTMSQQKLERMITDERLPSVLGDLITEGFITYQDDVYRLSE